MSDDLEQAARRIAEAGRRDVVDRLRTALSAEVAEGDLTVTPQELDHAAAEAVRRADGVLWRRALAGAAASQLGIGLAQAVTHPAVRLAHERVGAPPYRPGDPARESLRPAPPAEPESPIDAVRVPAVHVHGIESLRNGEPDVELRFSDAGLDVLKRSTGATIGRLRWQEIQQLDLPRPGRGLLPGRRRAQELSVATAGGRATFQLPEVTEEQLRRHLRPMLARTRRHRAGGEA